MRSKNNKGFTLIEVMVALFIFLIISIITTTALHSIFTTKEILSQHEKKISDIQFALSLFSNDIQQMIDRFSMTPDAKYIQPFIGTKNELTFNRTGIIFSPDQLDNIGAIRVAYKLKDNHLVRVTWPGIALIIEKDTQDRQLLDNIKSLTFTYYDKNNRPQDKWPLKDNQNNYDQKREYPKAVKISLTGEKFGTISQIYQLPQKTITIK